MCVCVCVCVCWRCGFADVANVDAEDLENQTKIVVAPIGAHSPQLVNITCTPTTRQHRRMCMQRAGAPASTCVYLERHVPNTMCLGNESQLDGMGSIAAHLEAQQLLYRNTFA